MDVMEAIRTRKSVRAYLDTLVDDRYVAARYGGRTTRPVRA